MARLFTGEREINLNEVLRLLRTHDFGLKEAEVADLLGWERRTANNYLRELEERGLIYKEGRLWQVED